MSEKGVSDNRPNVSLDIANLLKSLNSQVSSAVQQSGRLLSTPVGSVRDGIADKMQRHDKSTFDYGQNASMKRRNDIGAGVLALEKRKNRPEAPLDSVNRNSTQDTYTDEHTMATLMKLNSLAAVKELPVSIKPSRSRADPQKYKTSIHLGEENSKELSMPVRTYGDFYEDKEQYKESIPHVTSNTSNTTNNTNLHINHITNEVTVTEKVRKIRVTNEATKDDIPRSKTRIEPDTWDDKEKFEEIVSKEEATNIRAHTKNSTTHHNIVNNVENVETQPKVPLLSLQSLISQLNTASKEVATEKKVPAMYITSNNNAYGSNLMKSSICDTKDDGFGFHDDEDYGIYDDVPEIERYEQAYIDQMDDNANNTNTNTQEKEETTSWMNDLIHPSVLASPKSSTVELPVLPSYDIPNNLEQHPDSLYQEYYKQAQTQQEQDKVVQRYKNQDMKPTLGEQVYTKEPLVTSPVERLEEHVQIVSNGDNNNMSNNTSNNTNTNNTNNNNHVTREMRYTPIEYTQSQLQSLDKGLFTRVSKDSNNGHSGKSDDNSNSSKSDDNGTNNMSADNSNDNTNKPTTTSNSIVVPISGYSVAEIPMHVIVPRTSYTSGKYAHKYDPKQGLIKPPRDISSSSSNTNNNTKYNILTCQGNDQIVENEPKGLKHTLGPDKSQVGAMNNHGDLIYHSKSNSTPRDWSGVGLQSHRTNNKAPRSAILHGNHERRFYKPKSSDGTTSDTNNNTKNAPMTRKLVADSNTTENTSTNTNNMNTNNTNTNTNNTNTNAPSFAKVVEITPRDPKFSRKALLQQQKTHGRGQPSTLAEHYIYQSSQEYQYLHKFDTSNSDNNSNSNNIPQSTSVTNTSTTDNTNNNTNATKKLYHMLSTKAIINNSAPSVKQAIASSLPAPPVPPCPIAPAKPKPTSYKERGYVSIPSDVSHFTTSYQAAYN